MNSILRGELPCFRCGVCCTKYQVCINTSEAQRLADHLNLEMEIFLRDYTDSRWPGKDNFLVRHRDGACIFLDNIEGTKLTGCRIHMIRPRDCRDWTPEIDRPECRHGLEKWGLQLNLSGNLAGTPENIKEFLLYMASIRE